MKVLVISVFLVSLSVLVTSEVSQSIPHNLIFKCYLFLQPSLVKTANECAKMNKIPHKEAMGIMMSYKVKKKTHNVKCFINCIFERSVILDILKKRFKREKSNCDSIKDADKCEESSQKFECFLKTEKNFRKNLKKL
ncbi:hypothetical protein KR084_005280 [Drosophila pseudotakahashii]|nr:hypothetical protein KR084_005280 [Drosophila pseudotakahashii]